MSTKLPSSVAWATRGQAAKSLSFSTRMSVKLTHHAFSFSFVCPAPVVPNSLNQTGAV
ncbi:hypothetical protein D3C74_445000 [compost metagenome]